MSGGRGRSGARRAGTGGAARSGSGWPGSGQRSARTGNSFKAAWQGARGTGETEQVGVVGALAKSGSELAKDCHGVLGRFRAWRELGGKLREIGGTIRGRTEVLGALKAELETRQRLERMSLGKAHSEAVRKIESKAGEVYRYGLEGSEKRARDCAVGRVLLRYGSRPVDWYRLTSSSTRCRRSVGSGAGDRRRAGLREDEAGSGEGRQEKASQEKAEG